MNHVDVGTIDLIAQVVADYAKTGHDEFAAHGMELLGIHVRETRITPVSPANAASVKMAAQAMHHWRLCHIPTGDGWDMAYSCDNLVSGWLLARFYLNDHVNQYRKQIALARSVIAEIEEAVDPRDALAYIRKQPPLLWIDEPWNNGIWRSYYFNPDHSPYHEPRNT